MATLGSEVPTRPDESPVETLGRDWLSPPPVPPGWDGDWRPGPGGGPPLSNGRLGVWMLLAAETMFFGGLVGAFLVLRGAAPVWPPPLQPRLPVGVTAGNTFVLLLSSYALARALRALRRGDRRGLVKGLGGTAGLGALFLAVQGMEWVRLVRFGLTASSGAYGATFYTLIGVHAFHVLCALVWATLVLVAANRGRYTTGDHEGLVLCAMYWHFVVAVWPVLYVLVYLA